MHPLYSLLNSVTPLPALQCRSTICCLNSGVYDFRFLAIVLNSFFYKGSLPPCCVSLFSFSFSLVSVSCLSAFSVLSATLFRGLQWSASSFRNRDYLAETSAFSASEIPIQSTPRQTALRSYRCI